jgi:uncharacterized protein YbjT (DUF2867 family)
MEVIIHTASSPYPAAVEIEGGRHLLEAARKEGVGHFVYISIIGVEDISYSYYVSKYRVEKMIMKSGLKFSILRSAQFHTFLDRMVAVLTKLPVIIQPKDWKFQPVSAWEVAERLASIVKAGPQGRVPDIAGPEVLTMEEIIHSWMEVHGISKPVVRVPLPGSLSRGFRSGLNIAPKNASGKITWSDYFTGPLGRIDACGQDLTRLGSRKKVWE